MKIKTTSVLLHGLVTNLILSVMQIIVGIIGSSMAVVSDGVHTFSDLLTDIVAIVGGILSNKKADNKHPFGHGMYEYLTSLLIGFVIIFMGLFIIYNSISKEIVIPSIYVIIVTIITIVAKSILSSYILVNAKKYNSAILLASGNESRADVISSLLVLASVILIQLSVYFEPLKYADIIAAIIVSLIIIRVGYHIVSSSISGLLGERETDPVMIDKITKLVLASPLVSSIESLILLKYGHDYKLVLEVYMDDTLILKEVHAATNQLERSIHQKGHIKYVSIHVSPKSSV